MRIQNLISFLSGEWAATLPCTGPSPGEFVICPVA